MEPLSLKAVELSWMSAVGTLQVRPPSWDCATSMALEEPASSAAPVKDNDRA